VNKNYWLHIIFILFLACAEPPVEYKVINYALEEEDFLNPERGFYRPFGTKVSNFKALDFEKLQELQKPTPAAGGFQAASALTYRNYQLDVFKDKPLSNDLIQKIQADFNIIRQVGNKLILRFSYSDDCCTPPFKDAPKEIILLHLNQLKPILSKHKDVIAVVQMGMIGPWGEQFYSDYFGDLEHGPVTNQHWLDRNEVIDSLLSAVPISRMIQVRAPYYKLRYLNGEKAHPQKATPLTEKDAFGETPVARLAHHNDCILANYDDYWTYHSFHEWPAKSDTLHLKPYIAQETKYLVFGGETCPGGPNGEDVYNPYNNCFSDGGSAENYLKRFHTSFLNTSWSGKVNGDWAGKCIEEIKKNLGYRFVLKKGLFPNRISENKNSTISLEIENTGYASPYNSRSVELVLQNNTNKNTFRIKLDEDPRFWFSDEIQTLNIKSKKLQKIPKGEYELFLNLPDPEPSLNERPEYSIRLAAQLDNKSVWNQQNGWNKLFHTVTIE